MQREILFRGKVRYNGNHLFSGDWVFGSLILKSDGVFIYVIEEDEFGNIVREFEVEVIPETVGQFTVLTDKKGVKIFEGDVCTHRDSIICEDKKEIEGLLVCENLLEFTYDVIYSEEHSGLNGVTRRDIEVIGNIHDNPELLNK